MYIYQRQQSVSQLSTGYDRCAPAGALSRQREVPSVPFVFKIIRLNCRYHSSRNPSEGLFRKQPLWNIILAIILDTLKRVTIFYTDIRVMKSLLQTAIRELALTPSSDAAHYLLSEVQSIYTTFRQLTVLISWLTTLLTHVSGMVSLT